MCCPHAKPARHAEAGNRFALDGAWTLDGQSITPANGTADIVLNYNAREVQIVVSGSGTLSVEVNGTTKTIAVPGAPAAYQWLKTSDLKKGMLTVKVSQGTLASSFTFG